MYKMPLFLTTKCAPLRRWVVRLVKVGMCFEFQKHAKTIDLMGIDTHIYTMCIAHRTNTEWGCGHHPPAEGCIFRS